MAKKNLEKHFGEFDDDSKLTYSYPELGTYPKRRLCTRAASPPALRLLLAANNDAKENVTGSILTWPSGSHGYDNDKQ